MGPNHDGKNRRHRHPRWPRRRPGPHPPRALERLQQFAAQSPPRFNLRLDGPSFSLLADNTPLVVSQLKLRPEDIIVGALEELIRIFPPPERTGLSSTLRSVEYRPNQEIQTLYVFGPTGRVVVQQQTVASRTTPPAAPLTRRQRLERVAFGLVAAALVLVLSTFVIDYRGLYNSLMGAKTALNIPVENTAFSGYLTLDQPALSPDGRSLILHLHRTPAYPLTDAQVEAAPATGPATRAATQPGGAVRIRLALDALARGYLRVEQFDEKNKFIASATLRIADLRTQPDVELTIPLNVYRGQPVTPHRIVITY